MEESPAPELTPELLYLLSGDAEDFAEAKAVAGYLTPVPGGVGPMTITMLLANTIASAEQHG